MKKIIGVIVCISMCFTLFACSDPNTDGTETDLTYENAEGVETDTDFIEAAASEAEKEKVKTLDIYIIAGQSNAAGYTKINEEVLKTLWSSYKTGSSSVLYQGKSEYTNGVNASSFWVNAKAGQGKGKAFMGPELGIAKVLSEEYYDGAYKTAGIIKFAHGGTSLLNKTDGQNAENGNWVSPSYAEYLNIEYSGLTGELYRSLLEQVSDGMAKLEGRGYEAVNIKGLFWMQGESDRDMPNEYSLAFKYFANDIRRDLSKIMNTELSQMPIIIGEISETSGSASVSSVATNKRFISMQRALADELNDIYLIASSQYRINELVNGVNVYDEYQNDNWHWNTEKMFRVGELVGRCIVDNILKKQ